MRGDLILLGDGQNIKFLVEVKFIKNTDKGLTASLLANQVFKSFQFGSDELFFQLRELFTNALECCDVPSDGLYYVKQTTALIGVFDGKTSREIKGEMEPSCKHSCDVCECPKELFADDPNEVYYNFVKFRHFFLFTDFCL